MPIRRRLCTGLLLTVALLGPGRGRFAATAMATEQLAAFPDGEMLGPVAGDWNGDGRTDLLFWHFDQRLGLVLRAKLALADGTWTSTHTVLGDGQMLGPVVGDFNGDGTSDVCFYFFDPRAGLTLRTKLSRRDGTWQASSAILGDGPLTGPVVGDFDGDRRSDLLFFEFHPRRGLVIRPKLATANGDWRAEAAVLADGPSDGPLVGDVDGNGTDDLVFSTADGRGTLLIRTKQRRPDGTWRSTSATVRGTPGGAPVGGDFDGDGHMDLALAAQRPGAGLAVSTLVAKPGGGWTTVHSLLGDGPLDGPLAGDFNGDGRQDLIFWHHDPTTGLELRTKLADGSGGWAPSMHTLGYGAGLVQNRPLPLTNRGGPATLAFWWFNSRLPNPLSIVTTRLGATVRGTSTREALVRRGWNEYWHETLRQLVQAGTPGYTQGLYDLQYFLTFFVEYAATQPDLTMLDEVAEILLLARSKLTVSTQYWFRNRSDQYLTFGFSAPVHWWSEPVAVQLDQFTRSDTVSEEVVLHSAQFLYLVARTINLTTSILPALRTGHPNLVRLLRDYPAIVLDDHYLRWIFGERARDLRFRYRVDSGDRQSWNLYQGTGVPVPWHREGYFSVEGIPDVFTHERLLQEKRSGRLARCTGAPADHSCYSTALSDIDMWILGGTVEMLAARMKDPSSVSLSDATVTRLLSYVRTGASLFTSRLAPTTLVDFYGRSVAGFVFDPQRWQDHPAYAFAGTEEQAFPTMPRPVSSITYDIDHGSRLVYMINSLLSNPSVLDAAFRGAAASDRPTIAHARGLAAQFAYGVFAGDFRAPLFRNYLDGSNGWNQVGLYDRLGFGYAPFDHSRSFLYGGWPLWGRYLPEMRWITDSVESLLDASDETRTAHRRLRYDHCKFIDSQRLDCGTLGPENPERLREYAYWIFLTTMILGAR